MTESVLIANRGEVAVRIARAASEIGLRTVALVARDEADALHGRLADSVVVLPGEGTRAYLDVEAVVSAAVECNATLLHPGYGFLSERAELAARCAEVGVRFVGPDATTLQRLGDKLQARELAVSSGVPVARGLDAGCGVEDARALMSTIGGPIMLKAAAGGGGRGMREVWETGDLPAAWERCQSEAEQAFGDGTLYAEELVIDARHVEVQVLGDGRGGLVHVGDRECSAQRHHQKLIEIAPAPALDGGLRSRLHRAALQMAAAVDYVSLGTFEFLIAPATAEGFVFLEANPRLQVEHTVTELVHGIDLVATQLQIALGASLSELGIDQELVASGRGTAIQVRLNAETVAPDGSVSPSSGTIEALVLPSGPGVRVDTGLAAGSVVSPRYDSLLAKVIVHSPRGIDGAAAKARRALREISVVGVRSNVNLLDALMARPELIDGRFTTSFVETHLAELVNAPPMSPVVVPAVEQRRDAKLEAVVPDGVTALRAASASSVVAVLVKEGQQVAAGTELVVLEAMKMESVVVAGAAGRVRGLLVVPGDLVDENDVVVLLEEDDAEGVTEDRANEVVDLDEIRVDLQEVFGRHALADDESRVGAVERRHATGRRTIRENVADLIDAGTMVEYGRFAIAAQRARHPIDHLVANTPADGLVAGLARVNGEQFGDRARCAVLGYDYMVFAGTQGLTNHAKKDRMFDVIRRTRVPVVFFAEGGGGRPGDTDHAVVAGLNNHTFTAWAGLSGVVPRIAVVNGRCFAGNAAIAGSADLIVATRQANLGMGGPVMIEGGGLGVHRPEDIGPAEEQFKQGVVDVLVDDDAAAVAVARQLVTYFQGGVDEWSAHDARGLRRIVPENRMRVYDVLEAINLICDVDSVLELRAGFAPGMITALGRLEGRPVGVIANNPRVLSGAITSDGADKASRFLQLCDAFDLPVLSLVDTPGIMVGPEAERSGLVRHASRLFVTAASLSIPFVSLVLRKGYGLGSQAMTAGGFHDPLFTAAWPTGEFGGMGLEGAVRLGYRKELEAIEDEAERDAFFRRMVDDAYQEGKALNVATYFELDAVIDPADSRGLVLGVLESQSRAPHWSTCPPKRMVDVW